jgi:hypothetical protein
MSSELPTLEHVDAAAERAVVEAMVLQDLEPVGR